MNTAPFNKSVVYVSPIEDMNTLCRSGTIDNNDKISSFINAVLYACSYEFLSEKDENERIKQINKFKNFTYDEIYRTDINFINFKNLVKTKFIENLLEIYNFLINNDSIENEELIINLDPNREVMTIIFELISLNNYEKIVNKVLKKWDDFSYETFKTNIMLETIKFIEYNDILEEIEEAKLKYIKENICYLNEIIIDNIKVEEPVISTNVTQLLLNVISKHFLCDIYFIDEKTKYPKYFSNYKESRNNISIIILSFDDIINCAK